MRMNAFITCLVHVFFKSLNLRVHAARAAIFAGVQPSRLRYWEDSMLSGGVAPGYSQYSLPGWIVLLAVCGWFNQTLFKSIIVFGEAGRKLMQMYGGFWRSESRHLLLSLVFLHVSSKSILAWRAILWVSPGCSPGIAEGKDRLAWRAIRPRRWRREPQRQRRTTVAANGLKAQRAHSPGQVSAANDTPGHV